MNKSIIPKEEKNSQPKSERDLALHLLQKQLINRLPTSTNDQFYDELLVLIIEKLVFGTLNRTTANTYIDSLISAKISAQIARDSLIPARLAYCRTYKDKDEANFAKEEERWRWDRRLATLKQGQSENERLREVMISHAMEHRIGRVGHGRLWSTEDSLARIHALLLTHNSLSKYVAYFLGYVAKKYSILLRDEYGDYTSTRATGIFKKTSTAWYEESANKGYALAHFKLGLIHMRKIRYAFFGGREMEAKKALSSLSSAVKLGFSPAKKELDELKALQMATQKLEHLYLELKRKSLSKNSRYTPHQKIFIRGGLLSPLNARSLNLEQLNGRRVGLSRKQVTHPHFHSALSDAVERGFNPDKLLEFKPKQCKTLLEKKNFSSFLESTNNNEFIQVLNPLILASIFKLHVGMGHSYREGLPRIRKHLDKAVTRGIIQGYKFVTSRVFNEIRETTASEKKHKPHRASELPVTIYLPRSSDCFEITKLACLLERLLDDLPCINSENLTQFDVMLSKHLSIRKCLHDLKNPWEEGWYFDPSEWEDGRFLQEALEKTRNSLIFKTLINALSAPQYEKESTCVVS